MLPATSWEVAYFAPHSPGRTANGSDPITQISEESRTVDKTWVWISSWERVAVHCNLNTHGWAGHELPTPLLVAVSSRGVVGLRGTSHGRQVRPTAIQLLELALILAVAR